MSALRLSRARLEAFAQCGHSAWLMRSKQHPELFRVISANCHDRFCVPCGGHRRATIRANLARLLPDGPHRFLTLTVRHADEPLSTLLDRLYAAFRRLRKKPLWTRSVTGGVAMLEIKRGENTPGWHPHLHCIIAGRYIDRPALSREWLTCTGDSQNVHLRLIRSTVQTTSYITKYATKPIPTPILQHPPLLKETIEALAARRTMITFGQWRRWRLCVNPDDDAWELYAHLNGVHFMAETGDGLAERVLTMMRHADPKTGIFEVDLDIPEPDW